MTGIYPHSVVAADLNGDGKPDLFVPRGSSNVNTIIPNNSTPGVLAFGTPVTLPNDGIDEEGAAAGDLDGDGKIDLVVANGIGAASVSIYQNTGSFTFTKIDLPVVNGPYDVTIGDLDGDGKPDLIIPNNGANVVSFYRNLSTPGLFSFAARVDITVGTNPFSVAIGDLDGDGKPDLAIVDQGSSGGLYVMMNTSTPGTLSFGTPVLLGGGGGFNPIIRDLDGDGIADVGIAGGGGLEVFRNLSTPGTFAFAPGAVVASGYIYRVVAADLDGDGKPDLAAAVFGAGAIALHNNSTPGTIAFQPAVLYSAGADPRYLAASDVDGDGLTDLLVANTADTAVSILRNQIGLNTAPVVTSFSPGTGGSGTVVQIRGSNFTGVTAVSFGGVSAAGYTVDSTEGITAVVGAGASGNVAVTTANGTASLAGFNFTGPIINSFSPSIGVNGTLVKISGVNFTGATAVTFGGVAAASYTVDSAEGITATVGTGASGNVVVSTPAGSATKTGFVFGVPTITQVTPVAAAIGDTVFISGGNFSDVAAGNIVYFGAVQARVLSATTTQLAVLVPPGATYQPISVEEQGLVAYSSQPFSVLFSVPDPTLTASSFVPAGNFPTGTYPRDVAVGDLDGDGKLDVVVANAVGNTVSVLGNRSSPGTIAFAAKVDLATGNDPQRLAIADLDGDGKLDILALDFNNGNASDISIFRNTSTAGSLSFANLLSVASGSGSTDIGVTDMNGDGRPDIVVTSGNSGGITVFLNTTTTPGNLAFDGGHFLFYGYHPSNQVLADLDNDGRPDMAISNFAGSNMNVFSNLSTGGNLLLNIPVAYPVGNNPTYVSAGDLDGDGLLDIAVANYGSGTVSLYRNGSSPGSVQLQAVQGLNQAATTLSFADLNGDGKIDLTTGKSLTGAINVYQNTSTGPGVVAFADSIVFPAGTYDTYTAVADLDGDGKPDVIAATTIGNNISVLRNVLGAPAITALSMDSAVKGDTLTITGVNFGGVTGVLFGGLPADSYQLVNPGTIRAKVGGGASGKVTVLFAGSSGSVAASIGGFVFIPQVSAVGATRVCKGSSVQLSSTSLYGNQWYKNGAALTGDTTGTLAVLDSGTYTVMVQSVPSPAGVRVTVIDAGTPVITRNATGDLVAGDSAIAAGDTVFYQWSLNGAVITGAISSVYHPQAPGTYTVQLTDGSCAGSLSAPYSIAALSGQIDLGGGQYVSMAPNPVQNSLTIYWNISGSPSLSAVITDPQGRQMKTLYNIPNGSVVDMTGLPKGVYYIKIYNAGQLKINKTVEVLKVD